MPISVRLDKETEDLLEKTSRILMTTKSEVVKKSIKQYYAPITRKKQNLSNLIKELIKDCHGSGRGDLSIRHKEILKEMLRKKHDSY